MHKNVPYPRNQSRLYNIKSPLQLYEILDTPRNKIDKLLDGRNNYDRWVDKKTKRDIQRPKKLLDYIHRRIAKLLSRIEVPEFLYSATKGKSYIKNAYQHTPYMPSVKVDIRKYYISIRPQAVFHFFYDRMRCAKDVSGILTKILTVDGHLATGSSVSPILSYFSYEDMFHEMNALALERGCIMTCYIDDVVFTGRHANRQLIYDIKKIIKKYRLYAHKIKSYSAHQPKVITGVAITKNGPQLPNKRQKIIRGEKISLLKEGDINVKITIAKKLVSRLHEAAQINHSWKQQAIEMSDYARRLSVDLEKI